VTGRTWVFGYGSLVSPASLESTIGRPVTEADLVVAQLDGYGRRWNYGSMHLRGDWIHEGTDVRQGLVVSLGLVTADSESCNGVAVRVTDAELAALDWRERDYERTDVTDRIRADRLAADDRVVTYVPRPSAVERYERARDARRAGVRRSYRDLVAAAFAALGADHVEVYHRTPPPDVPVVDMSVSMIG
jgi:dephospho-CoA kinase